MPRPTKPHTLLQELNKPRLSLLDEGVRELERSHWVGKIAEYAVVSLVVAVLTAYQWAQWFFKWNTDPLWFSFIGGGLVAYAIFRIVLILPRLQSLGNERQGAAFLRASLARIASRGWYVFENVRHRDGRSLGTVLAGPGGVYSLTSRIVSRRGGMFERVEQCDQGVLKLDGHEALADPIGQAQKAQKGVYDLLGSENLDTITVKSILVFPGWSIGKLSDASEDGVLIVNESGLESYIRDAVPKLQPRQVIEVCSLLEKQAK